MSHSVTTTVSYILNKYSRSYPSTSSFQGAHTPVESGWQHFTNPVMTIILEAKKAPSGQLASMRLRILWSLHTECPDSHIDQREVIFEDLELLSFSSLPTFQASAAVQSDLGLPLKAVYRDAVVGIRYLHPMMVPPGSQPAYRRFQITFKDAMDASRFVDAIKSVCPCKANPHPDRIGRNSTMLSASLTRASTNMTGHAPTRTARLTESQSTTPDHFDPIPVPVPSIMPSHPQGHQVLSNVPLSLAPSLSSDDSAFVTCSEASHGVPDTREEIHRKEGLSKNRGRDWAQSSIPNSSQTSTSDQSTIMPPPPVPLRPTTTHYPSETANADGEKSQLLASLSQHPCLYELSRADLETLVSRVIREEGFVHLLESLDSLWSVKGFLGR